MNCCCISLTLGGDVIFKMTKQSEAQFIIEPQVDPIKGTCYYEFSIYDIEHEVTHTYQITWTSADGGKWMFISNDSGNILYYLPSEYVCPVSEFSAWQSTPNFREFAIEGLYIINVPCSGDEPVTIPEQKIIEKPYEDYFPCKLTNFLKKKKGELAITIAENRNHEMFGLKGCSENWDNIFMKSLIIDALQCGPYGVYSDETENCLIGKLNENCNC